MDLPKLYAAVVAVRPELAVSSLHRERDAPLVYWVFRGTRCNDFVAAALILARWVGALPVGFVLYQRTPNVWECDWINDIWDDTAPPKNIGPTPIEALAAFYLGESK